MYTVHYFRMFFLITFSMINLYATEEWTKPTVIYESTAIVKTVPQILEDAAKNNHAATPAGPNEKGIIKEKPPSHPLKEEHLKRIPLPSSSDKSFAIAHPFATVPKGLLEFTAATYPDSGVVPPDAMGVVGPSQFILGANGRIRSFDKTSGLMDHAIDISTDMFFSPVSGGSFTTDSRIRYDRFSGRWVIIILAATVHPVRILLAISDSEIITPDTQWSFFHFEPYQKEDPDYPTLGIDKHALYIGVNIFGGKYTTSEGYVIQKSSLLKGKLKVFAFRNLVDRKIMEGPATPHGVDNFDSDATEGFFIGNDFRGDRLIIRRIKDPGGDPMISNDIPIMIENGTSPLKVPQKGSFSSNKYFLQDYDKRLGSPHIRDQSLYTSFDVSVDNVGKSSGTTTTRNGCRWYQIDLKDPAHPSIVQTGTLYQPSKTNDKEERYYWMSGIMTNGLHTMMLCCSTSGDHDFADAAYAFRFSNDPLGKLRNPKIYTKSDVVYTLGKGSWDYLRWGEYSHSSVDPLDNLTFWNIAEFSLAYNSWGLQVVRVPNPPPAKVIKVIPSTLKLDQDNIKVSIIGERIDGSAFYDPGQGYSKRLSVEIDGVDVQSIQWISPTQIDLIISTKHSSSGVKEIKITNPDGQVSRIQGMLELQQSEFTNDNHKRS